ncbi:FAD-dependent oxidoreductase [Streptomyces sp. NPDC101249]|uniref:FAD-dependent oxidoreductase n=1 Tax=Streptomyces sp. NPDC101249 TaxID=3366140 RepID=UPI0038075CFD
MNEFTWAEAAERRWDVVVVGGGPAARSAARDLAGAGRSVLVVDTGENHGATAGTAHGDPGRDGVLAHGPERHGPGEAAPPGGHVVAGRVTGVAREDAGFAVVSADGDRVRAGRVLIATGSVRELPLDAPEFTALDEAGVPGAPALRGDLPAVVPRTSWAGVFDGPTEAEVARRVLGGRAHGLDGTPAGR